MSIAPDPARRRAWLEPRLAAALGIAVTVLAFYPGLMSIDSAVQYAQAMGVLPLDDVHPPLMTLLWRLCDRVIAGPGALFVLFVAGWWSGLAALCWQSALSRGRRWIVFLLVGFWPATFLMLVHVWKDIGMTVALLLATAATLAWRRRGRPALRALALVALLLACGFRYNAVFAALPILVWLCWPRLGADRRAMPRLLVGIALACVLALVPAALGRSVGATPVHPWTVVALWDLAAMSIEADRVLLPASVTTADLSVADLRRGYVPWANPPLFDLGKVSLSFYAPYSQAQLDDLAHAWRDAVREDPWAYLKHRARLARYLLLGFPPELPRELVYVPQRIVLDGVALAVPPVDENAWPWRVASRLRSTALFAGGAYLLLALIGLGVGGRRLRGDARELVVVLAVSSWANALPLLAISGSAEFRYLTWTALAAVLALALSLLGARRDIG